MEMKKLSLVVSLSLLLSYQVQAATITVTEMIDDDPAVDNGECSLREAVITANTDMQVDSCVRDGVSVVDLIQFDPATDVDLDIGSDASFAMTLNVPGEDAAMSGDLDVLDNLRIQGNFIPNSGSDKGTVIAADGNDRVFHVLNNAFLQLENAVVIAGGGVPNGAGIAVNAGSELTLRQAFLFGNNAESSNVIGAGGGIYSLGNVTIEESGLVGNRVRSVGTANLAGGGIAVQGDLTMIGSAMITNELIAAANAGATGGSIFVSGNLSVSDTVIDNSNIEAEDGDAHGGHIYFAGPGAGMFNLQNSFLRSADIEFTGTGSARGAGIYHGEGQATIERTTIFDSDVQTPQMSSPGVALGGGIFALDPLSLTNATIMGNEAVSASTAEGGAIYLGEMDASLVLNNVTIFGNQAVQTGGGGLAGGISNVFGAVVTVGNSIIAGNATNGSAPDCRGDFTSAGYNLIGDESGCSFSAMVGADIVGTAATPIDPLLVPVLGEEQFGPFEISGLLLLPLDESPAIDSADLAMAMGGSCEDIDQRGESRPKDGDGDGTAICDMGAYEGTIDTPVVSFNDALGNPEIEEDAGSITFADAVVLSHPVSFQVSVQIVFDAGVSDAMLPADFDFLPAIVTFAPGETTADLVITPVDDAVDEPDEVIVFKLGNVMSATLGMPDSFMATLKDPIPPQPDDDDDDDDGCSGWEYLIFCAGDGCSMGSGSERFDPLLILMLLLSGGYVLRRSYIKHG